MGLIKKFADYAGVKHEIDPTGHVHTTNEQWLSTIVATLTSSINGKANTVHTHAISDVTNLQSSLDGKAASVHTHQMSDVTGLTSALSSKANSRDVQGVFEETYAEYKDASSSAKADVKLNGTLHWGYFVIKNTGASTLCIKDIVYSSRTSDVLVFSNGCNEVPITNMALIRVDGINGQMMVSLVDYFE